MKRPAGRPNVVYSVVEAAIAFSCVDTTKHYRDRMEALLWTTTLGFTGLGLYRPKSFLRIFFRRGSEVVYALDGQRVRQEVDGFQVNDRTNGDVDGLPPWQ